MTAAGEGAKDPKLTHVDMDEATFNEFGIIFTRSVASVTRLQSVHPWAWMGSGLVEVSLGQLGSACVRLRQVPSRWRRDNLT